MLKPVTKEEKLDFTLRLQTEKACDELIADLFYVDKYTGYVDIWFEMKRDKKGSQLVCNMSSKKIVSHPSPLSHPDAIRYHMDQSKGVRRIPFITK